MRISLFCFLLFTISFACKNEPSVANKNKSEVNLPTLQEIDVDGAKKLISGNRGEDFVILDVRTPDEISEGKLGGAVELDFYSDNFDAELDKLDKSKTYLVYCRSGNRSGQAAEKMVKLGFKRIYNLEGGFSAWLETLPK